MNPGPSRYCLACTEYRHKHGRLPGVCRSGTEQCANNRGEGKHGPSGKPLKGIVG